MLDALDALDRLLLPYFTMWHSPWLDAVMVSVIYAGSKAAVWLLLAAAACLRPLNRAAALRVVLTVGLAYAILGLAVKPLVARPRPAVEASAAARGLPELPRSYAFPSDRATAAFGAAVAMSRLWPRATALWWLVAATIGYALVYVGNHYPTDILGAVPFGVALAFWVLGGRHPATYTQSLPNPLPRGMVVRP